MILEHKLRSRYKVGDFGIDYQSVGSCLVTGSIGTLYNVVNYSQLKFHRDLIIRDQEELDYFKNIYIQIAKEILSTNPELMYPQPFGKCSCDYYNLCYLEMTGQDVEDTINSLYNRKISRLERPEVQDQDWEEQ